MANSYTVLDLETTGLSAAHLAEIIEVAAYHTDGINIYDSFHEYIKPWKPVPKNVSEINHITNEMLEDKKNKWQILPKLREFIGDTILVAHNANFDFNFLNVEFFNIGQPLLTRYICTQTNYKKIFPKQKYNLSSVAEKYNVVLNNAHSALADTRATTEVFIKMLSENELDTVCLTEQETLVNTLKRIVTGPPHKAQTALITDTPISNNNALLDEKDILSEFRLGKTPNDICSQSGNNYYDVSMLFKSWINNLRVTKFYKLMNDKKLNKEIKALINVSNSFDELLSLHKDIYGISKANLSVYALYWALLKEKDNMEYSYKDFEWHFYEHKKVLDIAKEFSISPFLVADFFVEFAINNREEYRKDIANQICLRDELKAIVKKEEYLNIVAENPSDNDIKKYIAKKLYDKKFFKISFD